MSTGDFKISVCVPIYNQEKYIEQCCVSLFEQTYNNIEFIFVDDASTDNSLNILHETIQRYPNRASEVKIIECEFNKGLWNSRNLSIENATGEYIVVCDSDDWMEFTAVANLVEKAKTTNADIVCTPYFENENSVIKYNCFDYKDINTCRIDVLHFSWCNKLIRRNLIVDNLLRIPENLNCWEDLCVTARLFSLTDKIELLDIPYYHYRKQNQVSYTSDNHKNILAQHLFCAEFLDDWFLNRGEDFYTKYQGFIYALKFTAKIKMLRGESRDFKSWKETYPEVNSNLDQYKWLSLPYKILFHLADKLPLFICNLFS